jgi:hypothetical protein
MGILFSFCQNNEKNQSYYNPRYNVLHAHGGIPKYGSHFPHAKFDYYIQPKPKYNNICKFCKNDFRTKRLLIKHERQKHPKEYAIKYKSLGYNILTGEKKIIGTY